MLPVPITALYAGILALLVTALGINVTAHRAKFGVMLGDGDKPQLRRMIRIDGNVVEYVPIGLLLMGLYELDGGLTLALHAAGIALIVGRLMFVPGMLNTDGPNPVRASGVTLTWITIAALAVLNLWRIR